MDKYFKRINRALLWFSIGYFIFYVSLFVIGYNTSLSLTSNNLLNVLALGIFFVPLAPIVWLINIRKIILKIISVIIYILILIPIYWVSFLAFIFILYDVLSWNNNGYRPVFEKNIKNNEWLIIYRTPDERALGGDHIQPAIVRKVMPGFEMRKYLSENLIIQDSINDSDYIIIEDITYRVPKEYYLRQKGNLGGN